MLSDAGGGGEDAHGFPVATIQVEGDAHPFALKPTTVRRLP
jgi:hypothetical protein